MTPTLRTILLVALAVGVVACNAVAVLFRSPAWAFAGQLPLVALLFWISHELGTARGQVRTAIALIEGTRMARVEADKPPLTQDDYAALLRDDDVRAGWFRPREGTLRCARCGGLGRVVVVAHPIWDGPFDGAGSGVVDERLVTWCLSRAACDGLPPREAGRPVRLPYLDTEPIALLPELYGRQAFHRLGQRVIPAPTLPPIPTHAYDAKGSAFCDVCGYAKDDPRHAVL